MLAPEEIQSFARTCSAIADEIADDTGFVPIHRLLSRFHARLFIQPLLVEGMLASIRDNQTAQSDRSWAVLVDFETYPINEKDIETECQSRPLPARLRNTIAHELVHSLAFRPSEFGIRLDLKNQKMCADELVLAVEEETERLSPLLLWPDKSIAQLVASKREPLKIEDIEETRQHLGISRYILINRLNNLRQFDPNRFLQRPAIRNLAIGLGQWCEDGSALVKSWPVFANFERNLIPEFIWTIRRQDRSPADTIFSDNTFAMCGGVNGSVELVTHVGTATNPRGEALKIQLSVAVGNRKPASEFFFVARVPTPS